MPTLLPLDNDNHAIPAVRLKAGGAQTINATTISARTANAFAADTRVVSVYATAPVYLSFGSGTIAAATTDHYFPAGIYYDFAVGGGNRPQFTNLAALALSGMATVYVSEKE